MTPPVDRLYIAAKAPRPGLAKTRLARGIGEEAALALYRGFLCDLATRFQCAPFEVGWFVTPSDAWRDLAPIVAWPDRATSVLDQGDGDWTARQTRLFAEAAARGERGVVLISSDSPHVEVSEIEAAFERLHAHDLVLGSVHDGGYYLIGMRQPHPVLHGVAMSTGTVREEILARAGGLGLRVGEVAPLFDVDGVEDLEDLVALASARPDLAATRSALAEHGLLNGASRNGRTA